MNVKLLKQVRDYISRNPEKYNQGSFCGTACCIAGHAALMSGHLTRKAVTNGKFADTELIQVAARLALKIDRAQADLLFSPTWCGTSFEVSSHMDPEKRSKIAVKRINHFIKTRGAQ